MPRRRGDKWQGDVLYKGKRERRTFDTELEAKKFEADPERYFRPKVTLRETFRSGYQFMWRNTKNAKDQLCNTEELIQLLGSDKEPKHVDTRAVISMIEGWQAKGLSDKRINRKLSCLRKLLHYSQLKGHIEFVPAFKGFKEAKGRVRYLERYEETAIRGWLTLDKHKRFFDFLLYTGCRFSEAKRIKRSDIRPTTVSLWGTKGNTNRTVPLVPKARDALLGCPQEGNPWADIEYNSWHEAFTTAKRKAGLGDDEQVVPHVLRHTLASRLVQGGYPELTKDGRAVDIRKVKDWMGHASITTTMIYAHLAPNDLLDVAAVGEPGLTQDAKLKELLGMEV